MNAWVHLLWLIVLSALAGANGTRYWVVCPRCMGDGSEWNCVNEYGTVFHSPCSRCKGKRHVWSLYETG